MILALQCMCNILTKNTLRMYRVETSTPSIDRSVVFDAHLSNNMLYRRLDKLKFQLEVCFGRNRSSWNLCIELADLTRWTYCAGKRPWFNTKYPFSVIIRQIQAPKFKPCKSPKGTWSQHCAIERFIAREKLYELTDPEANSVHNW